MSSARGRIEDAEAIRAGVFALRANLAAQGASVADPETIVKRVVAAYLPIYNRTRSRSRKFHAVTQALAAMEVAQEISVDPTTLSNLHDKMAGARVIMGNADAVWTSVRLADGRVSVTRLEDGATAKRPVTSRLTIALTQMSVNESAIVASAAERRSRVSTTFYADSARKAMSDPDARWTFRTTSKGLRATRVA